jgi:hypothetical protein
VLIESAGLLGLQLDAAPATQARFWELATPAWARWLESHSAPA